MTLGCVMLYARDLARMREFYESALRTASINTEWTDTWALLNAGGTKFALHAIPATSGDGIEISSPPAVRENSPVKLVFVVEDVPSERARLQAMGVAILQRGWQDAAESCDCVDPEGNVFQIVARTQLPQLLGS